MEATQPHAGFRVWVTDEAEGIRCYCGWLDGREHYGTRIYIDSNGKRGGWRSGSAAPSAAPSRPQVGGY